MRVHALVLALLAGASTIAQGSTVYRCPGPPVLYTDQITAQEAKDRGCRTIEGAPITIVAPPRPRSQATPASGPRGEGEKVDAKEQRARDSDARRILEAELKREEAALAALMQEFNNGEPDRRGEERNFARYQERVEEMRNAIARKQADIAALRRELAKLPQARSE